MIKITSGLVLFGVGIGGFCSIASGTIIAPISAVTNMSDDTDYGDWGGREGPSIFFTIDQSGLSAPYVSGLTEFDNYVQTVEHVSAPGNDFVPQPPGGDLMAPIEGYVEYDLGQNYLIDAIAFWNFSFGSLDPYYGVREFSLSANGHELGIFTPDMSLIELAQADVFTFDPVAAQEFRLDITANGEQWLAYGEVAFRQSSSNTSPVPLPGTLWLLGSGVTGLLMMKGRKMSKWQL